MAVNAFIGGCDDQFGTKSLLRVAPIKKLMILSILSDDIEIDVAFFSFFTHSKSCDMKSACD